MAHLFISAAHKSSGKTTVTTGLCRGLAERGLSVQPFKKGPDYIDPMWLGQAARRPCYNLDFNTMTRQEVIDTFAGKSAGSDIALIEGNKGLYDGLDLDGSNSNAALATLVNAPVILVIDARGMTRGIAPLILGYQAFDTGVRIAGVILNQLGGSRHERKLRAVIEHYTDVPVLGAIHQSSALALVERHLGLMPSNEAAHADAKISAIAQAVAQQVDLAALMQLARTAQAPMGLKQAALKPEEYAKPIAHGIRIAIARDSAFGFYYPDDLQALQQHGAELVYFNTLVDQELPDADALFIGGGFPETHMESLFANHAMRHAVKQAIESGMPVYAECGGLMYLARSLEWKGRRFEMAGALGVDVLMEEKPQGRGYVRLQSSPQHPWMGAGVELPAHEFHYSRLINVDASLEFAYCVKRGFGINGKQDGLIYKNTLASYSHMRDTKKNPWTGRFVRFIQQCQSHKARVNAGG